MIRHFWFGKSTVCEFDSFDHVFNSLPRWHVLSTCFCTNSLKHRVMQELIQLWHGSEIYFDSPWLHWTKPLSKKDGHFELLEESDLYIGTKWFNLSFGYVTLSLVCRHNNFFIRMIHMLPLCWPLVFFFFFFFFWLLVMVDNVYFRLFVFHKTPKESKF